MIPGRLHLQAISRRIAALFDPQGNWRRRYLNGIPPVCAGGALRGDHMRSKLTLSLCLTAAAITLGACASPPPAASSKPLIISATGHGSLSNRHNGQYNQTQQKLLAMRAAKLDAFRNLAEQVYGFRLSGSTTISAFASQHDYVRVHIDAFVRGARVIDVTQLPDGSYQARVQAELPADFRQCLAEGNCPQPPKPTADCGEGGCLPAPAACTGVGCASASGTSLGWSAQP